ncbi:hypothetical protein FPQ18DRAFT_352472 [Pyronema domesticum]|uniref:Similar to Rho-GTPase-activating protein 8 acc. no. Q09697 n=1 Tax=Pyronema omphalodes (strain CBS 100304) TaxID=1076935 RepID=U4KY04_PYROM|nr:hypothetical protein FPQ18DRAFT_352472 [Pyronema domesticum]CCX06831.1 Similar to Rho-GTPase-activating protein 8; acc. no. Q09697 [Pyronema omphalodes CBS 100304]
MPGFADSFWSGDYAGGLGVLFNKLQQGIVENQQVLTVARLRADAEELYAQKLVAIPVTSDKLGGFARDDGATARLAYEAWSNEMAASGNAHNLAAKNIRNLVVTPFSKWCEEHADRVNNSHEELLDLVKGYDKQHDVVKKLRSQYFNKCRLVEDMEEETKFIAVPQPVATESPTGTSGGTIITPVIKLVGDQEKDDEEQEPLELGDDFVQPSIVRTRLADMLSEIPLGEVKVAFLGTYPNVATGEILTAWIMKNWPASSVAYAERIGQDLVGNGFLRLVGQVGNTFSNSSRFSYQFKPKAFQWAGVTPKPSTGVATSLLRRSTTMQTNGSQDSNNSPTIGDYVGNLFTNQHPGETPNQKVRREAKESDARYKAGVRQLDAMRCHLEEAIMEHLKFMERCEVDRIKAIKSVILDYSAALKELIPSLQKSMDAIAIHQESVLPATDLRYLIENYRTGSFVPKVIIYESYYNSPDEQTFGIDLEARARADRKRVPIIITTILQHLDEQYPYLEGDEVRRGIWMVDVPLQATHQLRNAVNNGKAPSKEVLSEYEVPIVASLLKLYLLELPDSLVTSQKYEIIKTVYSTHGGEGSEDDRLTIIQNTLGTLPLTNIATLDALTTHFTRFIDTNSAPEAFIHQLAQSLTHCILRPKTESSLTLNERHSYRLIRDLFQYKEAIFGALKRASSKGKGRPRGDSFLETDESERRIHEMQRKRDLIEKSKARSREPSPNPMSRGSAGSGGGARGMRFPVVTSANNSPRNSQIRNSTDSMTLEVPGQRASRELEDKEKNELSEFQELQQRLVKAASQQQQQSTVDDESVTSPVKAVESPVVASPVAALPELDRSASGSLKRRSVVSARRGTGLKRGSVVQRGPVPEGEEEEKQDGTATPPPPPPQQTIRVVHDLTDGESTVY